MQTFYDRRGVDQVSFTYLAAYVGIQRFDLDFPLHTRVRQYHCQNLSERIFERDNADDLSTKMPKYRGENERSFVRVKQALPSKYGRAQGAPSLVELLLIANFSSNSITVQLHFLSAADRGQH